MSNSSQKRDKNIYRFAKKYSDLFENEELNMSDLNGGFAQVCEELGFSLEKGRNFESDYPEAFDEMQELDNILANLYSREILGSIIYHKWHEDSRRNSEEEEPLDLETITWFRMAFRRLLDLASLAYQPPFMGRLDRLELVSNRVYVEELPRMGDESTQSLILGRDGKAEFTRSLYDDRLRNMPIHRQEFKISPDTAAALLDEIAKFFSDEYEGVDVKDISYWTATLKHSDGNEYSYSGPLFYIQELGTHEISNQIREALDKRDMLLFDGGMKKDHIKRIALKFHEYQVGQSDSKERPDDIWESIMVDRQAGTVQLERKEKGSSKALNTAYSDEKEIANFLDNLKFYGTYLAEKERPEKDSLEEPGLKATDYVLVITSKNSPTIMRKGSYTKNNPLALEDLVEEFNGLIDRLEEVSKTREV